jgi:hypothetical protein
MDDDKPEREEEAEPIHDTQPPPPRQRPVRSARASDFQRSALERLASELLKRGFEAGRDTLRQTDEALKTVGESAFTKEVTHHLNVQLGEIRDSITRAVANELGKFLRQADLASEMRRVLSGMTVETKIKLSFPDQEPANDTELRRDRQTPDDDPDER